MLARLEHLVDVEEMFDLGPLEFRDVVDLDDLLPPWVGGGHAQHFRVGSLVVGHPEDADRTGPHPAARKHRLVEQHERVERVAVLTERVGDEPVVGRIHGRGEEAAIEPQHVPLVVVLVLVPAPARDLDDDVDDPVGVVNAVHRLNHARLTMDSWSSAASPGCPLTSSPSSTG